MTGDAAAVSDAAVTVVAPDAVPLTIGSLLAARANELPDQTMLVVDDDRLTYGEVESLSATLARAMLGAGIGRGSRVALLFPNGSDFVVAWLAAARIGAVTVPISTFSTGPELVGLLRGSDATLLLAAHRYRSNDYVAALRTSVDGLDLSTPGPLLTASVPSLRRIAFEAAPVAGLDPWWTMDGLRSLANAVDEATLAAAQAQVAPCDPMVIVHTSGSTSAPKGVIHTHGSLIAHLDNLNRLRRYREDEVLFANSPFFWIGGFAYALLGTLVAGARLVASNASDASGVLDVIERERPTMVNGFAAAVAHPPDDPSFARRDLSSIRRGNLYPIMPPAVRPADPELRHAMLGMTETGSVSLASDDEGDQPEERRGSFGRPVPGFEIEVRSDGRVCGHGELGELWFRGRFLMEGYDGRERADTFDADGWFCTGDLVTVDDAGYVYFRGRSSEMIKTSGANVSPREVEGAIAEVSGLASHVVGIDDEARGQIVAALVVSPEAVDVEQLLIRLRERLSAYKVPRLIRVVPDGQVPMMSSGKVDLAALKVILGA